LPGNCQGISECLESGHPALIVMAALCLVCLSSSVFSRPSGSTNQAVFLQMSTVVIMLVAGSIGVFILMCVVVVVYSHFYRLFHVMSDLFFSFLFGSVIFNLYTYCAVIQEHFFALSARVRPRFCTVIVVQL